MIVAWFIRDLRNVVRAASNSLYYSGMRSSGRFGVKGEINRVGLGLVRARDVEL